MRHKAGPHREAVIGCEHEPLLGYHHNQCQQRCPIPLQPSYIKSPTSPTVPHQQAKSFIRKPTMRNPITTRPKPPSPAPIVCPALRADIPDLVRVFMAADASNLLSFVRYRTSEERAAFAKKIIRAFDEIFDAPQLLFTKAMDAEAGVITGVGIWQKNGYSGDGLGEEDHLGMHAGQLWGKRVDGKGEGDVLFEYISNQMKKFMFEWTRETKHLYLAFLFVDPEFQSRGIGSALLRWGHERADADGVPSFLVATPVGHGFYEYLGWKNVAKPLEIDLRKFVSGAGGGDRGWGMYTYYFMMRLPKTAVGDD
jgi:GNAT superfamily N-acetyltransferase